MYFLVNKFIKTKDPYLGKNKSYATNPTIYPFLLGIGGEASGLLL